MCLNVRLMYNPITFLFTTLTGSVVCDWRFKWTFWRVELWGGIQSTCWWVGTNTRAEDKPLQCRLVPPARIWLFSWFVMRNAGASLQPSWWFNSFLSYRFKGVCSLNNKLYVVGGSDPCGQKGLKNCDAFDPVTKTWSSCASLNISMCPTHSHLIQV